MGAAPGAARPRPDGFFERFGRSRWTAWVLLAVGVGLSLGYYEHSLAHSDARLAARDRRVDQRMDAAVDDNLQTIRSLARRGRTAIRDEGVDPIALQAFIGGNDRLARQTGVVALAYVQPNTPGVDVAYTYASSSVIGYNTVPLSALPEAAEALTRATDTGASTLSGKFPLPVIAAQPGTRPPTVFAVVIPVYATGEPPGRVAERQASLRGWMTAIVDGNAFVRGLFGRSPDFARLDIYDGTRTTGAALLSSQRAQPSGGHRQLAPERVHRVETGGHVWTFRSRAYRATESPDVAGTRRLLLLASLAVSALIFVIAQLVRRSERRAYAMVEEATSELARSEERFRALVQDSTDIIVVIDADGRLRYVSPAGKTLFGANVDRLLGSDAFELIHPDDRARAVEAFTEVRRSGRLTEPVELRARRANGDVIEIEAVGTNLLDNPAVGGLVVNVRDISERKRAQAELAEAQERFRSAFEHAPIGMGLATTDARIIRTNQAFAEMLGRSPAELVGTPIFDITDPDDWSDNRELMRQLFADEISNYKMEKRYLHADGHPVWASLSVSLVRDADGKPLYMIGQVEDVTERKAIGERLAHQAIHDPLTGLPNRVLFVDRLRQALERAKRVRQRVGVLFLDLDRFKVVNDSLGHATGDRLLVTIADRLRNALRPADTVARFGGDEFTVLCDDVADESTAMQLAERMLEAVARPVNLAEGEVFVTASIGIAVSGRQRRGTEDAETLLRDADAAMYRAKDQGRACSKLFDVHAHTRAVDHLRTANALHRALERREFRMHFQPVLSLETGRITGFEGLLRWQHPERGLVPPGDFIGLAEESGLIVPIGAWALEEACRQTARWQALRGNGQRRRLSISVNLSMRQLAEPLLPEDVERTLERTGLAADALWLEITETTLMHDAESAISALRALRALGVHLAVDDFGTGYSSLTYLKRFPVEALKVDQAFVDGLGRDAEDTAIVTACVSLAHALGLTVVAEGVETPVQLAELRTLGCELAQGYLFGAPQPASALGDRPADDVGTWAVITSGRL